jgi:alkylation response protein AidB-like acyl-CoA dehydrogenase
VTEPPTREPGATEPRLRELAEEGAFDLPLPGGGATRDRFGALRRFGVEDLSVGRLAEAHADGLAIKAEAGLLHDPRVLLGVWASGGPRNQVVAEPVSGGWRLTGRRDYCSGATLLDQALVTVDVDGEQQLLVGVDLGRPELIVDLTTWRTPALAATATATVTFDGVFVPRDAAVGEPGFYVRRPGFWAGSVGVAAVWAGGADGVLSAMRAAVGDDPHALAHLGAAEVMSWTMSAALLAAADEIDADPLDLSGAGAVRALTVRHVVERSCLRIIDRAARALGPGPLVADAAYAQRVADVQLYVRQGHAERDLEAIGRATTDAARAASGSPPAPSAP